MVSINIMLITYPTECYKILLLIIIKYNYLYFIVYSFVFKQNSNNTM